MPDIFPPTVINQVPVPGSTNVLQSSDVDFDIVEVGGNDVDQTTIDVIVDGNSAILNGAFQAGYAGFITSITNGFHVTINPTTDFPNLTLIVVSVTASDTAPIPNPISPPISWSFTTLPDISVPVITPISPTAGQTAVSPATDIIIRYSDEPSGSGVNSSTIQAFVGGVLAYDSIGFKTGFTGPSSGIVANGLNGFDLTIDPNIDFGDFFTVIVDADCEDTQGNFTSFNYFFETGSLAESLPPELIFTTPAQNQVNVDTNSSIFFRLSDVGSGVDSTTINALVNAVPAITSGIIQAGFSGSILPNIVGGFDVLVVPDVVFSQQQLIEMQVDALDLATNVMPTFRWYFYTEGYLVDLTPSGGSFNSSTSVNLTDNGTTSVLHYTTDDTPPSPGDPGTTTVAPPFLFPLPDNAFTVIQLLGAETASYTTIPVAHQKDNSTVRLWQLDDVGGTLTDDSSFANDLTAVSATSVTGQIDLGRQFAGVHTSRAFANTDFSWPTFGCLEFWYKPDLAINGSDERFYSVASDAPETVDAYRFGRTGEALFMEDVAGASTLSTSVFGWDPTQFYHLAFVWDNITTFRQIYRNGALVAQDAGDMGTTTALFGEMLGHSHAGVSGLQAVGTLGILDSVKLSSQIRTPIQIARDYLQGVIQQTDLLVPSTVARGEYVVDIQLPITSISPNGGIFNVPTVITLTTNEDGSTIYYTTDGTDPLAPGDLGYPGTTQEGPTPISFLVSQEGSSQVKVFSIDSSGNREVL